MIDYKHKFVLKPKKWEKIKERNERSIQEKFGNSLNFYIMQSKAKNDYIRKKIEATKRNYDVTEKKEYIFKKKLRKGIDFLENKAIIDNEKRILDEVQGIFGKCEVSYTHERNIADFDIGAIKRTDFWEPNEELEYLLKVEKEEKENEKELEWALYVDWKARQRSYRSI